MKKSLLILLIPVLMLSAEVKGEDDYEYLIVTPDALKNSWKEFVEFNKRRCLRTKVQTIDYIKANMIGVDDADKLRNFIKQEYEEHSIVYVLLGGDDDNNNPNDIPHRGFRASFYDYGTDYYEDKDIAADMYFSCLDGDWKGPNQYYGEYGTEDMTWEVYAARFPVDNETELNNMINKTIKYSEEPVVNEAKNVLLIQEELWNNPDPPPPLFPLDELIGVCNANGYTTVGFTDTWDVTKMYEWYDPFNAAHIRNKISEEKITWINHVGHANTGYVLKHYLNQVTDSNFINNGTNANFFLFYTQSCYAGSFDNRTTGGSCNSTDCIGEQFTAGISNGAVAFVGSSRYGTGNSNNTDYAGQRLHRYFHDALFNKKIHYLEMMNAYSKEINADLIIDSDIQKPPYYGAMKYACYSINILGDPALSVWTEKPQELQADHPDMFNEPKFEWDTKMPYTWIALLDKENDTIVCSQLTGEDGKCEIEEEALTNYIIANPYGKMKINVKAHNYLPYQGEILLPGGGIDNNSIDVSQLKKVILYANASAIDYYLTANGLVNISIFNSKGTLLKTIVNKNQNVGNHSVTFNSNDLSSGIYYCNFKCNNTQSVRKFYITR